MPKKIAAGLLMCRRVADAPEVLLVHPGGPYFAKKDEGSWSVPKGLVADGEVLLDAAKREFVEETGLSLDASFFLPLGEVRMKSGKWIHAWAFSGDCDAAEISSNTFEIEWPPRSGRKQRFPEVDRAGWFSRDRALSKVIEVQRPLVENAFSMESVEALFG